MTRPTRYECQPACEGLETRRLLSAIPVPGSSTLQGFSFPPGLFRYQDVAMFIANDGAGHFGLWKTDGTAAGTVFVKGDPTWSNVQVYQPTEANGLLYFFPGERSGLSTLWRTDGSPQGTVPVIDNVSEYWLATLNGILYFVHSTPQSGGELWRTDGTSAGTYMVKDIAPGPTGGWPDSLTAIGDRLFFEANDGVHGRQLWTSDGTADGTTMLDPANPIPSFFAPIDINGIAFFQVGHGTSTQLWRSDGTAAGTYAVEPADRETFTIIDQNELSIRD